MATVSAPTITPLSAALGAEVTGIDLDTASDAEVATIRELLLEHLVLFFPAQTLTLDGHVALGCKFGDLETHPNLPNPDDQHPEVVELKASSGGIADEWHTDVTFLANPSVMSIMHMVACPDVGGDTMWANQYLAYERLSAPMRELVDGLHAVHDATPHGKPEMHSLHPVVRVHPETGRRSLMVNEHFTRRIAEMSHDESDALLRHLVRWSVSAPFTVRYHWTPGTVAMWDNRCTQHMVLNDFEGERVIQRVTVLGDEPDGPVGPGAGERRWPTFGAERFSAATMHDMVLRPYR